MSVSSSFCAHTGTGTYIYFKCDTWETFWQPCENPEVLHLSSIGIQSLSPSNITKGLRSPSLLYMQSSDYWTGYKLCYFLHLTKNRSFVERWFERPTITELERENCALDSARVQLAPTSRWWAIKAVFIWSCLGPRVDWILVSIPITILYLIVYAKYFDECLCCLFLPHPCQASLLYGTALLCDSSLSLFCRFDQPESIFFAFAASRRKLARLCDTEPNSETALLQKQIHPEMTLNLVVLSLCLGWRPYGSIWLCLSKAPYVISASRL